MTNLAFYAKDKHGEALFLVRFFVRDGELRSSTTHPRGDSDYSVMGDKGINWWIPYVLHKARVREGSRAVHHYEVVGD